jgi:hypothetical protein
MYSIPIAERSKLMDKCNFYDLCPRLELEGHNVLFWLMFHGHRHELADLMSRRDWNTFEKIIMLDQEQDQVEMADDVRVHLIQPTIDNHPRKHTFPWWYWFTQINEGKVQHLKHLTSLHEKSPSYKFDALLGTRREHKQMMLNLINNNNKDFCVSYIADADGSDHTKRALPGWPGDKPMQDFKINSELFGADSRSSIIPYLIYNDSWYTLTCETSYTGAPFYTEKTAKPLLAKRIFVLVGNQYHIKGLQSFGFKTFDRIINESFDNYEQVEDRCKGAWDQIQWMLEQDPLELYEKVEDILEHNQQLMLNTDYLQQLKTTVHNIINT